MSDCKKHIEILFNFEKNKKLEDKREAFISLMLWPPDVFVLCSYLLEKSGGYSWVVGLRSKSFEEKFDESWTKELYKYGKEWREYLDSYYECLEEKKRTRSIPSTKSDWKKSLNDITTIKKKIPEEIEKWLVFLFEQLYEKNSISLKALSEEKNFSLCKKIITLLSVADEASSGVGIDESEAGFLKISKRILASNDNKSLCSDKINIDEVRALPKQHTPQCGITIRSLSHHLSF